MLWSQVIFRWMNLPRTLINRLLGLQREIKLDKHTYTLSLLFGLSFFFWFNLSLRESPTSYCPFRCSNSEGKLWVSFFLQAVKFVRYSRAQVSSATQASWEPAEAAVWSYIAEFHNPSALFEASLTGLLLRFARWRTVVESLIGVGGRMTLYGRLVKFLLAMPVIALHGHQAKNLLFPDVLNCHHDCSLLGTSNDSQSLLSFVCLYNK